MLSLFRSAEVTESARRRFGDPGAVGIAILRTEHQIIASADQNRSGSREASKDVATSPNEVVKLMAIQEGFLARPASAGISFDLTKLVVNIPTSFLTQV